MDKEKLLDIACKLGRGLLENGGEIYRVEESIKFFLASYGVDNPQVFAIPATIIVTVTGDDGRPVTQIERITGISQNMNRMHKFNDLCRWACRVGPELDELYKRLEEVNNSIPYPHWAVIVAYGVASLFFCLFWGGNAADAAVAFAAGIATEYCLTFMRKIKTNIFFSNLVASAVIALIAFAGIRLGLGSNMDKIIIGAIMTLVPGVAITNIMRDIISGDIITGTTKLAEVLLVATSIAIGIALMLSALQMMFGGVI